MNKLITSLRVLGLSCTLFMSGCVTIIDATAKGPIQTDPGKRSLGGYIDDKQLRTIVAVNIRKADPQLSDAHINVHSYNAVILLTGQVSTPELRELAGTTARKVNRVRQVYNEISVNPKISFGARTHDNYLHSKIKTKLLLDRDIESGRVEVIVEDDIVYLMGLMSEDQAERVTDRVRTTKGIKKVVRAIEYIQ